MLIILQISNIGPITYNLLGHLAVSLLLGVGCAASLGLVLGWDLDLLYVYFFAVPKNMCENAGGEN